jgi:hypothetical protein
VRKLHVETVVAAAENLPDAPLGPCPMPYEIALVHLHFYLVRVTP